MSGTDPVGFNSRDLTFASDGLVDSLTLSMAPTLFYQNLQRECATSERDQRELTIVSVAIKKKAALSTAECEELLIALSNLLQKNLRAGDFHSRISDRGFWVLLRADEASAREIIERLDLPRREFIDVKFAARKFLSYDEWIAEVDQLHFE
jgi:GGDEF domain-containing protein